MENAREVEEFMRDKYTNQELYSWMVGQLSGVYFQAYQLAYETAKRAELAFDMNSVSLVELYPVWLLGQFEERPDGRGKTSP